MSYYFYYNPQTFLVSCYSEKKLKILCKKCIDDFNIAVEEKEKKKKLPPVKKESCTHIPEIKININSEQEEQLKLNYTPYIINSELVLEKSQRIIKDEIKDKLKSDNLSNKELADLILKLL